ncbi:flagellar protein FlaG [Denitratisoma oestradiolicum]|uniref:Flagellar protein FlaG protein n=1 Tax=Denitratisoma oestradiolicum TaxID=311182 RepID=A0A6S6XZT7_9PROT|nr:flagellar protein FlaG [Denitratisoma oestradiolicum]TWO78662.1 hypothetical protein CBW56_18910 [Denitratisoma oestradiolicum]CAB1370503.1 Flagellar protein FlaG protein [Denitratisoma oestradiolicum]
MALTIGNTGTSTTPLPATQQGTPAAKPSVVMPEPAPPQQPNPEQLKRAVESMRELVQAKAPNSLQFSIDDETGKTIVRVTDVQTGEMIRQIPSEELLDIARALDKMQGLLLKNKA